MIKTKIESALTDNGENPLFSFKYFLYILSLCFSGVTRARTYLYKKQIFKSHKLPCKVISIGNIAVGGTGKTPMTVYTAELVQRLGYKTVIISRGYKGGAEETGGIVSDGRNLLMDYDMAGDEAFMMARRLDNIPVLVGKNRVKSGMTALEKFNPDVVILDDAFQHLKLARDIDLVLLDHGAPFGNGHLLPRGILREPVSALDRSDAIIFTRTNTAENHNKPASVKKPVFKTTHTPYIRFHPSENHIIDPDHEDILRNRNAYIFSGIAKNNDFRETVKNSGCNIAGISAFPDHHEFTDKELEKICRAAEDVHADVIVTTEKNYVGIGNRRSWPCDVAVVGINITFEDPQAFEAYIKKQLMT